MAAGRISGSLTVNELRVILPHTALEKKTAAARQHRDELARKGLGDQGAGETHRPREKESESER